MKTYKELSDRERFGLHIDVVKAYVIGRETTWEGHNDFTREYAAMLDKNQLINLTEVKEPGRPVEYPESSRHKDNREAQRRFMDKQRLIRKAMREGVEVSEDIKKQIISKISWLNAHGVTVVMGRLVKGVQIDLNLGDWFIPYAVEVMCREGLLSKRRKVIKLL